VNATSEEKSVLLIANVMDVKIGGFPKLRKKLNTTQKTRKSRHERENILPYKIYLLWY
jgi:hypothetical protein